MKNHIEYGILNDEWVLNPDGGSLSLGVYLSLWLDINGRDGRLIKYEGIRDYYVRNQYGYEYASSKSVNGILAGRYLLDPWNREFLVFPYERSMGMHMYEGYFAHGVYRNKYDAEIKGEVSNIKHNVILLSTTVHGCKVYCVDILAGVYRNK